MDANQAATVEDLFALGNACSEQGRYHDAVVCFERAHAMRPLDARICNNLASALARLQRYDTAAARYDEALRLEPGNADIWHNQGCTYEQAGRLELALASYERAVALNPRADVTFNNMANVLNALGHLERAHAAYRTAIRLAPLNTAYYRNFVQSKRLASDDPCFIGMQLLAQQIGSLEPARQVELHFALGQALDEAGQHEAGFAHLQQGNRLHRSLSQYNEAGALGWFRDLGACFTAQTLAQAPAGHDSDVPVFVIGMPRSGSSLIEQVLASHPAVFGAGERPDFMRALTEHLLAQYRQAAPGGVTLDVAALTRMSQAQYQALGADYMKRLLGTPGASSAFAHIVDKFPFNFALVGLIRMALPNARFIHSRRAPLETCLSCYGRLFQDVPFSYDLGELGRYYHAYDTLMAHWRAVLPPGVMLEVDYETLVTDFEPQVARMLAHCGLEWDDACLAFHRTQRTVGTASAAQVRRPLYSTSLKRWRPDALQLQPLLDGLTGQREQGGTGMHHGDAALLQCADATISN